MSKYVVTNGVRYLRKNLRGGYYLCDENDATIWGTYKQAQNALNNGTKGWWIKDTFYVEKVNRQTNSKADVERLIEADTSDFNRWLSGIGNFKKFVNTIEITKRDLASELSDIDQEISEVQTRRNGSTESERVKNAIDNLNKRTYTPRKLGFLFEGSAKAHQ